MQKNKKLKVLLLITVLSIGIISIAYAVLSTTLTVSFNKVTQESLTWDVHFKAATLTSSNGIKTYGTSATGRTCPNITVAKGTSITFTSTNHEIHLSKPGDGCSYKFTMENSGTIDAENNSITNGTLPSGCTANSAKNQITCGKIIYKIGSNESCSTLLSSGFTLSKSGGTKVIYACVYYDETATSLESSLPKSIENITFNFGFTQK